jgi:hypothetical protein
MSKAIVREHLEKIDGVSRTWFEWSAEKGSLLKTLVVEVDFDTDPKSSDFRQNVLDAIEETTKGIMTNETTMGVNLKIVPAGKAISPS